MSVVRTGLGQVRGLDRSGVVSFRGIPFAAAPQGPLRFRPPAPPAGWDGVRDCLAFGAAPPTREGFAGLAPAAILAVQDAPLTRPEHGLTAFGPVVDGDVVTGPPWAAIHAGRGVDLICGFTHEESRGQGPLPNPAGIDPEGAAVSLGLPPNAAGAYRTAYPEPFPVMLTDALVRMPTTWVAEAHARAGGRTWLYDFVWQSPILGAAHGVDVPFTFGNPSSRYAARVLGTPPPADFEALSDRVRSAWIAFAATGDPGWPRFDLARRRTRIWDSTPTEADDPIGASRQIWEQVKR
ncbi:MAG TPA: carboxylesterase family protein [Pseudonocardiaceae bacterium]|nr:carboxylesterase family protein [Pseudonocardiaceae bacterium]